MVVGMPKGSARKVIVGANFSFYSHPAKIWQTPPFYAPNFQCKFLTKPWFLGCFKYEWKGFMLKSAVLYTYMYIYIYIYISLSLISHLIIPLSYHHVSWLFIANDVEKSMKIHYLLMVFLRKAWLLRTSTSSSSAASRAPSKAPMKASTPRRSSPTYLRNPKDMVYPLVN